MRTKACWIFILTLLLLAAPLGSKPSLAQTEPQLYFPDTGHWVKGDFLEAYQRVEDPALLFGSPITEAFRDEITGRIVQYFQKARFEYHPEAIPELRVQLTPLGQYLYQPGQPLPIPDNFPACRSFPETGFQVCYAFLDFFNAHGGVALFGYPISNFETHDDGIVQYFQRSRFEWRPELSSGERVKVSDLGGQYFSFVGENPIHLLPIQDNNLLPTILRLNVRAFPAHAVTGKKGMQTVYVAVRDQNMRPISNAVIEIAVTQPDGKEEKVLLARTTLPPSNEKGVTSYSFPFTASKIGVVNVAVYATYDTLEAQTVTSYRVWW